jgi:hypothetical protein
VGFFRRESSRSRAGGVGVYSVWTVCWRVGGGAAPPYHVSALQCCAAPRGAAVSSAHTAPVPHNLCAPRMAPEIVLVV